MLRDLGVKDEELTELYELDWVEWPLGVKQEVSNSF